MLAHASPIQKWRGTMFCYTEVKKSNAVGAKLY